MISCENERKSNINATKMDPKHNSEPFNTTTRVQMRHRPNAASMDSISNSVSEQSASYPMNDSSSEKDTGSPSKSICSSASSSSENVQAHEMKVSSIMISTF